MTAQHPEVADRATAQVDAVMAQVAEELPRLGGQLATWLTEQIPALGGDPTLFDLLVASTRDDLATAVNMIRRGVPASEITSPPAAQTYARHLAQRGIAPSVVLRQYRLAQEYMLDWCLSRFPADVPDAVALAASRRLMTQTFQYVDAVCEQVVATYGDERERWLADRSAVRAEVLTELLAGNPADVTAAESALGHRLRRPHLGVVLWRTEQQTPADDPHELEGVLSRIAQTLSVTGRPLFVARDRASAWGWIPLEDDTAPLPALGALSGAHDGVHVALGVPATGPAGFRTTHQDALRAQRVAQTAGDRALPITSYTDQRVRAASLLTADMDHTRRLVADALGDLAADTAAAERLRATLLVFLAERGSHTATADRLHLHKNTVKYRVDKAARLRGKPLDQDRLDLELALIACEFLGATVLR
ncbi:PucR family transcriptional regulator [Streptomyces ipomoeae]|uniref:PucR family transcriptional regulator n=1 Tax=Streptomyces ipomoeae TaxID=103232 RepID=UPI0011466D42|nr:helix-turn-helix domain-containing protein [Streptomyces ipomoeae]MDX2935533.1 helix-turn-helix domain-containing protein [Streptomyces ipomoeae]TQE18360.1 hypothetical protein SipoB123_33880 [Streptomyces ipomoeae]